MEISFVSGFGPITASSADSMAFWSGALGIHLDQPKPGYFHTEQLAGVRAFAVWPLEQAAESTFGTRRWPDDLPVPQAWIEFDVAGPAAVAAAAEELRRAGHRVLKDAGEEPWGQTTARVLSPEGLLTAIAYTPWMHDDAAPAGPGAPS
ncbi:glyoxalase [Kocuria dechangensis]|uniref:Glyoxalase n=1 Tax=Kocuria dechangensis TaxID=1176249 RepID=A0A917GYY0_9MICC|nr:glyoxalase [Kocuria dechangensis]GGG62267.1 glyoxalase [Kocuria dechangensis]